MFVHHLGKDVPLSNAFLTYTEVAHAEEARSKLSMQVAPAITPTVLKVCCFMGMEVYSLSLLHLLGVSLCMYVLDKSEFAIICISLDTSF